MAATFHWTLDIPSQQQSQQQPEDTGSGWFGWTGRTTTWLQRPGHDPNNPNAGEVRITRTGDCCGGRCFNPLPDTRNTIIFWAFIAALMVAVACVVVVAIAFARVA